jgi:hypothetical protein
VKRVCLTTAAFFSLAAIGFMCACATVTAETALHGNEKIPDGNEPGVSPVPHGSQHTSDNLPDIGTKMPDGRVYAGLSMDTGKPSFVAAAGGKMTDGTVYAGISPDTAKRLYTTSIDAPGVYTWIKAVEYCKTLAAFGHHDWRVPSIGELAVQFANRADIGEFNETGHLKSASGYYWSSLQVGDDYAWGQRFNDGFHENFSKEQDSSLRCVR